MDELLPQFLCAADVPRLAAFVTTAKQDHDLPSVQSVINPQAWAERDAQLRHATTDRLAVAEIPGTNPNQSRIHRRLHSFVAKGFEPLVKRHVSALKFQLLYFPLNHWNRVIYR